MDSDFLKELEKQRGYLLRVARLQLRDQALAEDVVQDTLMAALTAQSGFTGKSTVKTWLTDEEADLEDFEGLFKENGSWQAPPADWGDPEESLSRQQFFDMMDFCLEKLPPNTARVFMMREVMELETDEICKELTINANNLWVILYRARMALRECLEHNWFAGRGEAA
jgi:RNA polymerase sigma-70 factor (ECF subfamily)